MGKKKIKKKSVVIVIGAAVCIAVIAVLAVMAFVFPSDDPERHPEGIEIISSDSTHPDVWIEITDISFSGLSPYIKIRWQNNSPDTYVYGEQYDILLQNDNGEFVSTFTDSIWNSVAYILEPSSERVKKYRLTDELIPTEGVYRFQTEFTLEKKGTNSEEHTARVEFRTSSAVEPLHDRQFSMSRVVYDSGTLSESRQHSVIMITSGMMLYMEIDGEAVQLGVLEEISLSKDNFDNRIRDNGVTDQIAAVDVRTENKRAWQLHSSVALGVGEHPLFLLLEQTDGALLFAQGEYGVDSMSQVNSDSSYLRYIVELEEIK